MRYRHLIVGCGYVGTRLARHLPAGTVLALARDAARARQLAALGLVPVLGDLDAPTSLRRLPPVETVFHLAPPPDGGDSDPRTRHLLAGLARPGRRPRRLVYVSTTGVYGNRAGEWLDEHTPIQPQTPRARRRADAEAQLRAFGRAYDVAVVILRVPGIYGPGRLPLEKLRQGQPVVDYDPPHYGNRIQVDDLVRALLAAARRGRPNRLYIASDGRPATQAEFLEALAAAAGLSPPPHITPAEAAARLSPLTLSFLAESRRLRNRRLQEELGVQLRYGNFRKGIEASLSGEMR